MYTEVFSVSMTGSSHQGFIVSCTPERKARIIQALALMGDTMPSPREPDSFYERTRHCLWLANRREDIKFDDTPERKAAERAKEAMKKI
jgi:hypothetical protein